MQFIYKESETYFFMNLDTYEQSEVANNILNDNSGNGNHGTIHGATWVENIYGCTDSYADNHNPDANWDDGSCTYPDNGDYSLNFDGLTQHVSTEFQNGEAKAPLKGPFFEK